MDQAVAPPNDGVTLDEVMSRRFELVETIARIAGKHKAELEPLNEELHLCETFLKDEMNRAGLTQIKTDIGMVYFSTKDRTGIENWDAVLNEVREKNLWHLLKKDVSKTAVKEYIEVHQTPPPGVKYETYRDLNWRRGKGEIKEST